MNVKVTALKYRQATISDLDEIQTLLNSYELPASDCAEHLANFWVADSDNEIVAVGAFENWGDFGLLRSFAVRPTHSGLGIAEEIFGRVKRSALAADIKKFYLLTTTADKYFEKLGFVACNRTEVPDSIQATKQFSDLCPASATVMVLDLNA